MSEESNAFKIDDLASMTGLSRRAVRFYVQQKLLDPPSSLGRGSHYRQAHLEQLRRINELQSAGHSLDEIRQILRGGGASENAKPQAVRRRIRPLVSAQLWTRVLVADGIELSFDARRFSPRAEHLAQLADSIRKTFGLAHSSKPEDGDREPPTNGGVDDDQESAARN
jgi:DNA-binding transcriptional MerR regulator